MRLNFPLGTEWGSVLICASLVFGVFLGRRMCGEWSVGFCLFCFGILSSFWPVMRLAWIHSLAALMALDFRRGNPTAFLRQTGMPDMSFLSVFLGGSPCDCVCCKAEGRGV